ncbi:MAG: hypothetical protein IKF80_06055 [Erysipelotrichaceae bacterium]|nr:hypothetical protein [Erysipelotrichaceae bacterium]
MANSTKHIRELCVDHRIDYKQLHQLILKSMENDGNYDYLDPSIVNKWYNCKTKSIDEKYVRSKICITCLNIVIEGISNNKVKLALNSIPDRFRQHQKHHHISSCLIYGP